MADDLNNENNIIISRMQQRRGLKQDLPQPLRPGEFGWTTDSQQLFIGTDATAPGSARFNSSSSFEATVNARQHTISIANNQIIAFTVPFIKYGNGEYNGITTVKQWQPTFARSVINAANFPESVHTSSSKTVFSDKDTLNANTSIADAVSTSTNIKLNSTGAIDLTGNIRAGDNIVIDSSLQGSVSASIVSIERDPGTGEYDTVLDTSISASSSDTVDIEFNSITNIMTGQKFKTSDMIVKKNGLTLTPDANNSNLGVPGPAYDFTFSAEDQSPDGVHQLVLANAPTSNDEVTVCYYSNADVLAAIEGNPVTGNISAYSNIPSFYTEYNIPKYRQFAPQNVLLSTTSGLGMIGLDNKHVEAVAEGTANLSAITGLTLGNLLIARDDTVYDTANTEVVPNVYDQYTTIVSNLVAGTLSPVTDQSGAYRYNRIKLRTVNNQSSYFHNKHFDLLTVDTISGLLNFEIPKKDFVLARDIDITLGSVVRYPGNGYTGLGTDTVATCLCNNSGIDVNDWVRVVDSAATNELHDTVFRVIAVRSGQVDLRVDASYIATGNAVPTFSQNHTALGLVNHGAVEGDISDTIQAVVSSGTDLTIEVSNVVLAEMPAPFTNGNTTIDIGNQTTSTFYLTSYSVNGGSQMATAGGTFYPLLNPDYGTTVDLTPVLSINLSANTTLAQAVTTVNRPLVPTRAGGDPEGILPVMDYAIQDNGDLNRIYLTQDPSFSSVDTGGIEFTLFEDRNVSTLSVFNLNQGSYTRDESTVRAKFEKWLNQCLLTRDVNLFSSVLKSETFYKDFPYNENDTTNRFFGNNINSKLGDYNLVVDDTYNDIIFTSKEEAANFNDIVNRVYAGSAFDRAEDVREGTRGLTNIRTNIEIQTRDQADIGSTILSFPTQGQAIIFRTQQPNTEVFTLPIGVYNAYIVEYSINDTGSTAIDTFTRIGNMLIAVNTEIDETAINDRFSAVINKVDDAPVIQPRFTATIVGNNISIRMEEQYRDPENPVFGDTLAHSIDADLLFKFNARRWTSYEV